MTDNWLAVLALQRLGERAFAGRLAAGMQRYGNNRHGLIEALSGETISWPPRTANQRVVQRVGGWEIWTEDRLTGDVYQDWAEYADLALYGALEAHLRGDRLVARQRYRAAMEMFDGAGFADKAFRADGRYATYKLALALYVGRKLGEPVHDDVLAALLTKQDTESGGFYAMYDVDGIPVNDANTETTAYALLALQEVGLRSLIYNSNSVHLIRPVSRQ
ncbi:MAG: hypothetical protein Kow0047_24820 [Anaerolineae bacterium]